MKKIFIILLLLVFVGCAQKQNNDLKKQISKPIKNKSFQEVWNQVKSDEIDTLPSNTVSFTKLHKNETNNIKNDAKRTLENYSDILKPFDKRAHPNGICFKGIWNIDTPNIYSGYFKQNSKALIIVRASTALSNTTSDDKRAFGFAGKLFPTLDTNEINKEYSANFFLIDDLGGTNAKHYTDVELTNEPKISFTMEIAKNLLYAIKTAYTFNEADKHSTIRQLYEISYLGEKNNTSIITPKWMKIDAKHTKKVDEKDFRDELKIKNNNKLIFNISVANKVINDKKNWQQIGTILLDNSVVSNSCDHRLHFHHPKYINSLNYGYNASQ